MRRQRDGLPWVGLALAWGTASALAIEQGNGLPVVHSSLDYVGKHQREDMAPGPAPPNNHTCTGTMMRQNVVLSAAHCVGINDLSGNSSRFLRFNRFELGGMQRAALAVAHPDWAGDVGYGNSDIALYLVLNGHDMPTAPAGTLATPFDEQAVIDRINGGQPQNVTIVGWSMANSVTSPNLLQGITRIAHAPPGSEAGEWTFDRTLSALPDGYPGSNWFNSGDSGGPTFVTVDGRTVLTGVHSFRIGSIRDVDTRVSPHLDFINGEGVRGSHIFNTMIPGGGDWNDSAMWTRAAATTNSVPQGGDITILDPTGGSDVSTHVSLATADSAPLEGLLSDVTLTVSDGRRLSVLGETGVLNGGVVDVRDASAAEVHYMFHNEGALRVRDGSAVNIGSLVPPMIRRGLSATGPETRSMLNARHAAISVESGSSMTVGTQLKNQGEITVSSYGGGVSTLSVGSNLPPLVATPDGLNTSPTALFNSANPNYPADAPTINVGEGGVLYVRNGDSHSAVLHNDHGAILNLQATGGAAVALVDIVANDGQVRLRSGGNLDVIRRFSNRAGGELIVGGDADPATATIGVLNNSGPEVRPGGRITISRHGTMVASRPEFLPFDGHTVSNSQGAVIEVHGGGNLVSQGRFNNFGELRLASSATDGGGAVQVERRNPADRGLFQNVGRVEFQHQHGAEQPRMTFIHADFHNSGEVMGDGLFIMHGDSSWKSERSGGTGAGDYNGIDLLWQGTGQESATLEAMSFDSGVDAVGLTGQFAINSLVLSGSWLTLVDQFSNEHMAGSEVVYTRFLGVDENSILDLNGITLYYREPHPLGQLHSSSFINGMPVLIPEPSTLTLLAFAGLMLHRRRRLPVWHVTGDGYFCQ